MHELPWLITHHARQRFAERTHAHLRGCVVAHCRECEDAKRDVARLVGDRAQDAQIRFNLRWAEVTDSFTDIKNGVPREIVMLEYEGLRYVVEVQEHKNVLLSVGLVHFNKRLEPSADEKRKLLGELWKAWKA